jgi:beta-lactamase regulating signal transducer with metallopeptidase domain
MLWWFAETTVVAAALAGVAAVTPRLRTLGPAARHALWLVVLVKLITPPLVRWPRPVAKPEPAALVSIEPTVDGASLDAPGMDEPLPGAVITAADLEAPWVTALRSLNAEQISFWALRAWLAGTAALAAWQVARILRFRRKLRRAVPAPDWMVAETEQIAARMKLSAPLTLVVPGISVPMLWCLGRAKLLLPAHLVETLGTERWRGILAHELAHLRRGDPWVGRLELVASLLWWWNPLFLLARRRLDAEAELACDAWVVWALPADRLVYAETMLAICSSLAKPAAHPSAPMLGVTGAGRFFERRLTMILGDHVPCRLSFPALLGTGLLALLASPSWSSGEEPAPAIEPIAERAVESTFDDPPEQDDSPEALAKAQAEVERARRDAERAQREAERAQRLAKQAQERAVERAERLAKRAAERAERARSAQKPENAKPAEVSPSRRAERDTEAIRAENRLKEANRRDREAAEKLGPEFERKMEDLGRKIESEMKEKFGPDFERKMKEMGQKIEKEVTSRFGPGSEFEKKMNALGKELSEKLGPEFEAKMKQFGDKFGPEFEKKMKEFGDKFGPDFEKKIDEFAEQMAQRFSFDSEKRAKETKPAPAPKPDPFVTTRDNEPSREKRIRELESKLDQIMAELKELRQSRDDSTRPRVR